MSATVLSPHFWRFRSVLSVEKLGQRSLLNGVDGVVVEPGRIAGNDDVVCLMNHDLGPREGVFGRDDPTLLIGEGRR